MKNRIFRFVSIFILAFLAVVMAMSLMQPANSADASGMYKHTPQATKDNPGQEKKATKVSESTSAPVSPTEVSDPTNPEPTASSDGNDQDKDKGGEKVSVCHVPPGNPANAHVVTIAKAGWDHGHDPKNHRGQGHELDFLVDANHPCPPKADVITVTPVPSATPTATGTKDPSKTPTGPDQPGQTATQTDPASTATAVPGCPVTVIVVTATPTATPSGCIPTPPPCVNPTSTSNGDNDLILAIKSFLVKVIRLAETEVETLQIKSSASATQTSLEVLGQQPSASESIANR